MRDPPSCFRAESEPSNAPEAARRRIEPDELRYRRSIQNIRQDQRRFALVNLHPRAYRTCNLVSLPPLPAKPCATDLGAVNDDLLKWNSSQIPGCRPAIVLSHRVIEGFGQTMRPHFFRYIEISCEPSVRRNAARASGFCRFLELQNANCSLVAGM
jgi:hypothetical protein